MWRYKPVMPRYVYKLVPPAANDHGNIETKHKWQRDKIDEPITENDKLLKHSAQRQPYVILIIIIIIILSLKLQRLKINYTNVTQSNESINLLKNQKFGAERNVSPSGAVCPIGEKLRG